MYVTIYDMNIDVRYNIRYEYRCTLRLYFLHDAYYGIKLINLTLTLSKLCLFVALKHL